MNMSSKSIDLTVKMDEISLSIDHLDNLASEFYGIIPAIAGSGDYSNETKVIFHDLVHPEFKTQTKALDCMNSFCLALDSFRINNTDPSI